MRRSATVRPFVAAAVVICGLTAAGDGAAQDRPWNTVVTRGAESDAERLSRVLEPGRRSSQKSRGATTQGTRVPMPGADDEQALSARMPMAGEPRTTPVADNAAKPAASPAVEPPKPSLIAGRYCADMEPGIAEIRLRAQRQALEEAAQALEKRIAQLEAYTNEVKGWLARREQFLTKSDERVTRVYARMKPEAAAQQLAAMDEETAAAILMKLEPKSVGAILTDMPAARAARMSSIMAQAGAIVERKKAEILAASSTGDQQAAPGGQKP